MNDANDVQIPFIGKLVMQAADNVKFGGAAALRFACPLEDLVVGHRVAFGALQIGPKGAEGAPVDTDVRGIQVRVNVVIGIAATLALANQIRQLANREQVSFFSKI